MPGIQKHSSTVCHQSQRANVISVLFSLLLNTFRKCTGVSKVFPFDYKIKYPGVQGTQHAKCTSRDVMMSETRYMHIRFLAQGCYSDRIVPLTFDLSSALNRKRETSNIYFRELVEAFLATWLRPGI